MNNDQGTGRGSEGHQLTEAPHSGEDRLQAAAAALRAGLMHDVTALLSDAPLSSELRSIHSVGADATHFDWLYPPPGFQLERVSEAAMAAMALDYVAARPAPLMAQLLQLAKSGEQVVGFAHGDGEVKGYSVLDLAAGMPWLIRHLASGASGLPPLVAAAVERHMERIAASSAHVAMGREDMEHLGHVIMALGESGRLPGQATLQTPVILRDRHDDDDDVQLSQAPFVRAFPSWMTDEELEPLSPPTVYGSLWAWLATQGATQALEAAHGQGHDLDEPTRPIRAINAALCGTNPDTIGWLVSVGADTEPVRTSGPDVEPDAVVVFRAARAQRALGADPQRPAARPL